MYIIGILMAYLAVLIYKTVKGPSVWNRLLGLNLIFIKVIIIIIVYSSVNETAYLLDFAIVYALLGFISIIITAQFLLERIKGGGKK